MEIANMFAKSPGVYVWTAGGFNKAGEGVYLFHENGRFRLNENTSYGVTRHKGGLYQPWVIQGTHTHYGETSLTVATAKKRALELAVKFGYLTDIDPLRTQPPPYKYHGDRATGVCENGHFTVAPYRICKFCGKPQFEMQILTATLRLTAVVCGYRDYGREIYALLRINHERGEPYVYDRSRFVSELVIPGVINPTLTLERLFEWEIVTGK